MVTKNKVEIIFFTLLLITSLSFLVRTSSPLPTATVVHFPGWSDDGVRTDRLGAGILFPFFKKETGNLCSLSPPAIDSRTIVGDSFYSIELIGQSCGTFFIEIIKRDTIVSKFLLKPAEIIIIIFNFIQNSIFSGIKLTLYFHSVDSARVC